jgi:anti-sigma factor RsiW
MMLFRRGARRPMGCAEVGRLLQVYLDGELDDETRARRLRAHLDDCRRCGLEAETYKRLKASLARTNRADAQFTDALNRLREFGERLARGEEEPST